MRQYFYGQSRCLPEYQGNANGYKPYVNYHTTEVYNIKYTIRALGKRVMMPRYSQNAWKFSEKMLMRKIFLIWLKSKSHRSSNKSGYNHIFLWIHWNTQNSLNDTLGPYLSILIANCNGYGSDYTTSLCNWVFTTTMKASGLSWFAWLVNIKLGFTD